jgi:hypothetical protein
VQNGIPKRSTTSSNVQNGTAPKAKPAVSAAQGVYKGSAQAAATGVVKKPDTKAQTTSFAPVAVSKPFPKPATAPSAASATNAAKPTPKKGSYADILARAKAAQEAKPHINKQKRWKRRKNVYLKVLKVRTCHFELSLLEIGVVLEAPMYR